MNSDHKNEYDTLVQWLNDKDQPGCHFEFAENSSNFFINSKQSLLDIIEFRLEHQMDSSLQNENFMIIRCVDSSSCETIGSMKKIRYWTA